MNIKEILTIADKVQNQHFDCNEILRLFSGTIEYQKVDDNYYKSIIRDIPNSTLTVIVDCKNKRVISISFNGSLNITGNDIFKLFGNYRESYSIRDDLYFYFFHEDKKNFNYKISFFEPSHKPMNIQKSDELISNLILSWD